MLLLALAAFQLAAAVPRVYNGRAGQIDVRPPRIDAAEVVIDGHLDEPVWGQAALLTGFSLYQPVDGREAPDSTQVLVWYSANAIHFGIRAFEPHGPVAAAFSDRDRVSADDNVELQIDTFDERNRALVFIANPLGIQADGTKSENGGFIPGSNVGPGQNDLSADFIWQSRGHVTDWGYEVEIRIPFSSMRFRNEAVQRWGFQVDRHIQHSGYEETWTPARRASASFIGQAGYLSGLTGMHHGTVVELNPELTNTVNGASCCAPLQRDWRYTSDPELGGNVRWNPGSNFVVNGTVRPDFSQVEADATQIAADERFALFYPEKRPFFVEALDQFNVPNTLVYTRTIVRPEGAAKLTGKIGRADVALLSAVDEALAGSGGRRPLVDIVRLRQSFGEQSIAGIVYSDRIANGRSNRVLGGDVHVVFADKYYAQFQAVESSTRVSGSTRSGPMWEAVLDGTGRSFGFHYNILGIHPDFRTDNGFVPRVGYVQPSVSNRLSWYGRPGALVERVNAFISTSALWRYDDFFSARSLLEDRASVQTTVTLRGGWNIGVTPRVASFAFDPASYATLFVPTSASPAPFQPSARITTYTTALSASTPQFRKFAASIGTTIGNDVDFLETSRIRRIDYNASLDLRPSARLRMSATYVASSFTRRATGEQSAFTRIPRLEVEYQIARPIFVRVVSQYSATDREPLRDPLTGEILLVPGDGTVAPSVLNASNALRTDWLFSYRPAPGTVFFAGYGGNLSEPDPLAFQRLRRTGDSFFVKASYVFRVGGS